jgi:3',5'-nucleoside bisphosphate phosphatase
LPTSICTRIFPTALHAGGTGRARQHGLACIALTDHDTVEGCAAHGRGVRGGGHGIHPRHGTHRRARGHEVHLLGYFLDTQNEKLLTDIARFQAVRQNRIHEMVARSTSWRAAQVETVFALANCKSPGRPHVARALVKAGLVGTWTRRSSVFLKKGRPAWVPKAKMSALEGVELIHQAGGLAVMAHPGLNRTDEIIPALVDAGWTALNVFTPSIPPCVRALSGNGRKFHLLVTGGSDCHGFSKGKPLIGTVKLPYEHVEKLKAAKAQPRMTHRIKSRNLLGALSQTRRLSTSLHRVHPCPSVVKFHGIFRQIQSRPAKNAQQAGARNQAHRHALAQADRPNPRGTGSRAHRRRPRHGHDRANRRRRQTGLRNPGRRGPGRLSPSPARKWKKALRVEQSRRFKIKRPGP